MADLIVDNVTKEFPTPREPLKVLRGVSLEMAAGENLTILGPSGSGKSTLLYIVGTLDEPTSGTVKIGGQDPFELSEPQLARFRNEKIGFVFQDHYLLPQCTVIENVLIPAMANGRPTIDHVDRAHRLLERVGLSQRLEHRPAELSGGERQRVAIARSLIGQPQLLLADEPTGNLDRTTATNVAELLLELQREERMMLLIVTHSLELARLTARQLEIDEGELKQASLA